MALLKLGSELQNFTEFSRSGMHRGPKKTPLPKICHTYPTMMKLRTGISYLKKIQKKKTYKSRDTTLEFC